MKAKESRPPGSLQRRVRRLLGRKPCPHRWQLLEAYEPAFPTAQLTWTPMGPFDITRAHGKWRCWYCGCVKVGHESQWIRAEVA